MTQSNDGPSELELAAVHAANALHQQAVEHPLASVAASAGVGYILAAGVPSWLVKAGTSIALRTVTREIVSAAVESMQTPEPGREAHPPDVGHEP